jgi:hypothetical protein
MRTAFRGALFPFFGCRTDAKKFRISFLFPPVSPVFLDFHLAILSADAISTNFCPQRSVLCEYYKKV